MDAQDGAIARRSSGFDASIHHGVMACPMGHGMPDVIGMPEARWPDG
jgi:hypothetical protein